MKIKSTLLLIVLLSSISAKVLLAQNSSEKILCKSFNLNGRSQILLNLDNPVEVKTWSESIARFEIIIRLENGTESALKSLVVSGRYDVNGSFDTDKITFSAPALSKTVKINNLELKEVVRYVLYVPSGVMVSTAVADLSAR